MVLGRSGCGKGTQAKFVMRRLGKWARHMETGRFLRSLVRKNNPTATRGREVMQKGGLFPAWFAAFTWLKELIEKGAADKHLIFDGAPRKVWEAELIDEVMKWHGRSLPLCIYVDVSLKEATRRLLERGRADDTRAVIQNRMSFFARDVMPVLKFYRKHDRLIHVNGNLLPNAVWSELERKLSRRLGKIWPRRKM